MVHKYTLIVSASSFFILFFPQPAKSAIPVNSRNNITFFLFNLNPPYGKYVPPHSAVHIWGKIHIDYIPKRDKLQAFSSKTLHTLQSNFSFILIHFIVY